MTKRFCFQQFRSKSRLSKAAFVFLDASIVQVKSHTLRPRMKKPQAVSPAWGFLCLLVELIPGHAG